MPPFYWLVDLGRIDSMSRLILCSVLCVVLAACATPQVTMKNPSTGNVVVCGGGTSGSVLGGYIGHQMQKRNDEDCVKSYEAKGYKRQN